MYISDLENKKRLFFSLLASCGLMLFLASLSVYMINGAEGLDSVVISACFLLTALSAIVILIGAGVSASQKLRGITRKLGKRELITGLGFLTYGSLAGAIFTLPAAAIQLWQGFSPILYGLMCLGCTVSFVFELRVLKSFINSEEKKK